MAEQSKEERVHHVIEKIYKKYDSMNSIISFRRHTAWREDVIKCMNIDVRSGNSVWSIAVAEATGKKGEVIGLDFSENMLMVAKEKRNNHVLDLDHLKFVHGNAMDLPYADNSFDYVTIGFGLRNVPDYHTVLKELYRVVKPGGKVVCLETSQPTLIGFRQLYFLYFRFIMPLFGKI